MKEGQRPCSNIAHAGEAVQALLAAHMVLHGGRCNVEWDEVIALGAATLTYFLRKSFAEGGQKSFGEGGLREVLAFREAAPGGADLVLPHLEKHSAILLHHVLEWNCVSVVRIF